MEMPTISRASLMAAAALATSPGTAPRFFIPYCLVQRKPKLPLKGVESSRSEEDPTTSPRLLIARAAFTAEEPRFPRSTGVPSASQRIARCPAAIGGGLVLLHTPDIPTVCPLSLIHIPT